MNNKQTAGNRVQGKPCKTCGGTLRYRSGPCVPCMARQHKRWRTANPEKRQASIRAYMRKRDGLPEPTRPEPAMCECCGQPPKPGFSLNLDHDHATGKFRGWLCRGCNMAIGKLGDTYEGLLKAYRYLVRAGAH